MRTARARATFAMTTPLRQRADESLRVDVPDWTISQVGRAFAHPVGTHTGRENVLYSLEAAERAVELLVEVSRCLHVIRNRGCTSA